MKVKRTICSIPWSHQLMRRLLASGVILGVGVASLPAKAGMLPVKPIVLSETYSDQITVSGVIKDENGQGIPGVSILIKGTSSGTISDATGGYSLNVPEDATLIFSFVGYVTEEVAVNGRAAIDISLTPDIQQLDEIVVTALGINREEKSLTYSAEEIGGDELTSVKDVNFMNSLSGKAAGVFINKSASGAGGSTRVVLRGNSSTRNNNVLYVIDGVPMLDFSPSQPSNVWGEAGGVTSAGRDGGDGISNINPEDIESMSVLKGASAAALYGSQAANGVILITTKKGKAGQTKVNYSSSFTVESILKYPDMQYSYGQTSDGALDSWGDKLATAAPDHVDEFFQNGKTWINAVSVSGGSENLQNYFSYANTHASGIMPTNSLDKHNFTFRESAKVFDVVDLNASINFINQSANNRPATGIYFNPLSGLYMFPRGLDFNDYAQNFEVYSPDRNAYLQNWVSDISTQQNPYWILHRNPTEDTRNRLISNVSASLKINDFLTLKARGNVDKSYDKYEMKAYASTQGALADANGRYSLQKIEATQLYGDVILSFNKTFNDFSVGANAGAIIQDKKFNTESIDTKGSGKGLKYANVFSLQNIDQGSVNMSTIDADQQLQSVLGSVNLGYKGMLYLDASARNDWSSTLSYTDNESFFYPSVGVSGVITEMVDIAPVNFLKLRASMAKVGNAVNPYDTHSAHELTVQGLNALPGVIAAPGETIKPEKNTSYEIGMDMQLLQSRLNFDVTYYNSQTENQRISIRAPFHLLGEYFVINAGDIRNKGIEAMMEVIPIENDELTWSATFNFTHNKNEVVKLSDKLDNGQFLLTEAGVNSYAMAITEGSSFGDILGKKFARDDQGRILLGEDGKPMDAGFGTVGNPSPKFMLSFSNTVTYKDLSLRFLIDGRFGGEVMSITQAMLDEKGVSEATADARDNGGLAINAVSADGAPVTSIDPETFYRAVGGRAGISEYYVYDATNVRLREVSLSYNLPKSIVSKINPIKSAKLSLIARNLFFFSIDAPFDPDLSMSTGTGLQGVDVFNLPSTRSVGFNLSLSL